MTAMMVRGVKMKSQRKRRRRKRELCQMLYWLRGWLPEVRYAAESKLI